MTPSDLLSYIPGSQVHTLGSSCTHRCTQTYNIYKPYHIPAQPPQTQGCTHTGDARRQQVPRTGARASAGADTHTNSSRPLMRPPHRGVHTQ